MALDPAEIAREVRRRIGDDAELPPQTDADVRSTGRSPVSADDLDVRILDAAKWACASVRASLVPGLVRTADPRDAASLNVVRVLLDRVEIAGVPATRQTVSARRTAQASGAGRPDANFPVFTLEGGFVEVYPAELTAEFAYVTAPDSLADVPDALRSLVVARASADAAVTAKRPDLAALFAAEATALASPLAPTPA